MKFKEGFALRTVCGMSVVTATGLKNLNYNKLLNLNSTAAFLWEKFYGSEFSIEDLANALVEQYGIDLNTATADCEKLVETFKTAEVLAQ